MFFLIKDSFFKWSYEILSPACNTFFKINNRHAGNLFKFNKKKLEQGVKCEHPFGKHN